MHFDSHRLCAGWTAHRSKHRCSHDRRCCANAGDAAATMAMATSEMSCFNMVTL